MGGGQTDDAAAILSAAMRERGESLGALMIRHGARDGGALLAADGGALLAADGGALLAADGGALLAALGCAGNADARWEALTYDVARQLLPRDRIAALIEGWLPGPTALCALGAAALAAGADPLAPTLAPE